MVSHDNGIVRMPEAIAQLAAKELTRHLAKAFGHKLPRKRFDKPEIEE